MKKRLPALIASFIITIVIAFSVGVVSVNALINPNSVDVSNTPGATSINSSTPASDQAQIQQLQARINEYQQREQQYQAELQSAQQQLQQDQFQIQQFQQFILALQSRGLIQILNDGSVIVTGRPGN